MQISKKSQDIQTIWGTVCVVASCLHPIGLILLLSFFRLRNISSIRSILLPIILLNVGLSITILFSVLSPQPSLMTILREGRNSIIASEQMASWRRSLVTPIAQQEDPIGLSEADCFRFSGQRANFILYTVVTHKMSQDISASIYLKTMHSEVVNAGIRLEERLKEGVTKVVELSNQWQRYELTYQPEKAINPTLILFNPPGSADVDFCAWGAQIEESLKVSSYVSIKDEIQLYPATVKSKLFAILQLQAAMLLFLCIIIIANALTSRMLYWGCLSAFLIQSLYAIIQKIFYLERSQGLSFQPNVLATQIVLLFAFLFTKSSSFQTRLALSLLSIISIWTTGSRIAFVVLLIMLCVFFYKDFVKLKHQRLLAFGSFILGGIVIVLLNSRLVSLNPLADPRLDIFSAMTRVFFQYPWFGWGVATSQKVLVLALWQTQPLFFAHTHNLIAETLLSIGFLGFLLVTWLFATLIRDLKVKNANFSLILISLMFVLNLFDLTLLHSAIYLPLILIVVLERNAKIKRLV